MSNGNFKVRCIDDMGYNQKSYTVGKVYKVVDGFLIDNDGYKIGYGDFQNVDDVNRFSSSKFESAKESETITITRHKKKAVATLTDGDREYSQYVKLSDADGDFLKASLMVVERLCDRFIKEDTFDWESFKSGKFAVHCDTEEKAKEFLKECDKHGIKYGSGTSCLSQTHWNVYKEKTCYEFYHGFGYGCNSVNGAIIEYPFSKPTVKEVKRPAKVGEWIKFINVNERHRPKIIPGDICKVINATRPLTYINPRSNKETNSSFGDDEYVVLENYQPEKKPDRPFLDIYSTDELLAEIRRRIPDAR